MVKNNNSIFRLDPDSIIYRSGKTFCFARGNYSQDLGETQAEVIMKLHNQLNYSSDKTQEVKEFFFLKKETSEKSTINFRNPAYFFKLKKDKSFIIERFLGKKTVNMLYGHPGSYKSLIAEYAGICISNGLPFLGLQTKKNKVAILDRENSEQGIKERLELLHKGLKLRRKNYPLWYVLKEGSFQDPEFIEELVQQVKDQKIGVVVFDTWRRYVADGDENSSNTLNKIYADIFTPITEAGASVLFLHHSQKGNNQQYRGSSDLLGMVDCCWSISKTNPETNQFMITCQKNRSGELENLAGSIDFQEDYAVINAEDVAALKDESKAKFLELADKVLEYFPELGSQNKKSEITTDLTFNKIAFNDSLIKKALSWLVKKKKVLKRYETGKLRGVYERIM